MYIKKKSNPPFFDWNFQFVLNVILAFELQTITIVNFNSHKLFNSLILNFDGVIFCSLSFNFDEATFCSQVSILMQQHFAPQLSILRNQHFACELPNHHHISSISFL
jgi:hypothetical protein